MDFSEYRKSEQEQKRINDLMFHLSGMGGSVLDVGARDGFISIRLTEIFDSVTALDLEKPVIQDAKVTCVRGDITSLNFQNEAFDVVICAEVLEHIQTNLLEKSCSELTRVAKDYVLVGVPYRQDTRAGKTTCFTCGKINPPWGHINLFDQKALENLFRDMDVINVSYIGKNTFRTNFISSWLMNLANNPYGTYSQEECCIHCNAKLIEPPPLSLVEETFSKIASYMDSVKNILMKPYPNWIHVLFSKNSTK